MASHGTQDLEVGAEFKVGSAKLLWTFRSHVLAGQLFGNVSESLLVRRIRTSKLFGDFSELTRPFISTDRPTHVFIVATRDNICLTESLTTPKYRISEICRSHLRI
jgi:hypothetical protein